MTDKIITQLDYLNEEKQKIALEIGKLKKAIYAHCYEIFPTLEEIAGAFNLDSEFIEYYRDIRGKELKLRDLVDKERNRIVKFSYPIRLYEESKRGDNGKIINFYSGARLGIDLIDDKKFIPSLIFENKREAKIIYRPDITFINEFLYKELCPETRLVDFLKNVVKNLSYWDNSLNIKEKNRIIKRFEDNYLKLQFLKEKLSS